MRLLSIAASLLLASSPAWALYKVVGPDGRVTYTDRPPPAADAGRIESFRPTAAPAPAAGLPAGLHQVAQRYPVTLYTTADCVPCDSARQLLVQRGIPFAEKRVATDDDLRALEQLGAGRNLPGLSIGTRQLRGLNTAEWTSYLDAAGYPRESRLPKGWKPPAAAPLAEDRAASAPPPASAAADDFPRASAPAPLRRPPPAAPATPTAASTLRF